MNSTGIVNKLRWSVRIRISLEIAMIVPALLMAGESNFLCHDHLRRHYKLQQKALLGAAEPKVADAPVDITDSGPVGCPRVPRRVVPTATALDPTSSGI